MASLQEYRQEQLQKIQRLRDMGVNPYPAKSYRTHSTRHIITKSEELQGAEVVIAGRLVSHREHGKIQFLDIEDGGQQLQAIAQDTTQADHAMGKLAAGELTLLTRGDFIEVEGVVGHSESGELSVMAKSVRILSKVIRPLPEKLEDQETRMRRRYLDMAVNPEIRKRFERRSTFWAACREFLDSQDFVEINIPVLEHTTGGADANPFVTHMDALDHDFYLRISHELPLKRLIGAGYEKVYDLGPRFRNENYSDEHLPEHVAIEWYWAYADWNDGMQQLEEMFRFVIEKTFGTLQFNLHGMQVDLSKEWERWDYAEVIQKHYGIDVYNTTLEEVQKALVDNKLEVEKSDNIPRIIDKLWKKVRATVVGPVWLINTPTFISPLSKTDDKNPQFTQRFQAVIAGSELSNGFSELNDPVDQLDRFLEQQRMRDGGDEEAMMLDVDYVEMLEYGMPPTCGFGFSERVFWIFEGVTAREGVPFPQLKSEADETTKEAYPEIYGAEGLLATAAQKPQDFSKRIVAIVNKTLEPWQVANTAAHMSAYHAHKMAKDEFDSGTYFVTKDSHQLPRNSQYPILIKRADMKDLRKLYKKAKDANIKLHVFIREMIETNNDAEIVESLKTQSIEEVDIYGIALYGDNDAVNALTKHFQLWN